MLERSRPIERRYHVNSSGIVYIFVMALLGIGAINSQNNLLFILFGVALGAMAVSGFVSGFMMLGLRVARLRPQWAQVGKPMHVDYSVSTKSRVMPAFALELCEVAKSKDVPAGRYVPPRRAITTFLTYVPTRGAARAQAVYTPTRRGVMRLERIRLFSSFPFGLMRKSVSFIDEAEVLVWPELIEPAGGVRRAIGRHGRSPEEARNRRGAGQEFYGLRGYVAGDPPRAVAWKASARLDTLLTRQNTEPVSTRLEVQLFLERPSDACPEAMVERAISMAAGFVSAAQREGLVVALRVPQANVHVAFGRSGRHVARMLDVLAAIDLERITDARGRSGEQSRAAIVQIQPRATTALPLPDATLMTCGGAPTLVASAREGAPA
ncbi:MAG: DUF58 domain-containing protein [Phycisphaerales bacterium]|nr:DUF58 domain-containing protein [Phycisphaerales bacterium]